VWLAVPLARLLALALLLLGTTVSAQQIPLFTGPDGANPIQNPVTLPDFNTLVNEVNAALIEASGTILHPLTGAFCNGVTDDTAAVQALDAAGGGFIPRTGLPTYLNTCRTTTARASFNGPFWGYGRISDSNQNLLGPFYANVSTPPAVLGTYSENTAATSWNGDFSKAFAAIDWTISGLTLGQPTSGYVYTDNAYPFTGVLNVNPESGWNNSLTGNGGRTAAVFSRIRMFQFGQGDAIPYSFACTIASTKPTGATSFLARPACGGIAGDILSTSDGGYINPYEVHLRDNGHDAAAVGIETTFTRTNNTGALGVFWNGVQFNNNGTVPTDTAFNFIGKWRFGLVTSGADLSSTGGAAIATARDQCWYGNASTTDPNPSGVYRYPAVLGTDSICNTTALAGWVFGVGGGAQLQVTGGQVSVTRPFLHNNVEIDTGFSITTPVSGGTLAPGDTVSSLIIVPATTLGNLTITLPPSPQNGRVLFVATSQTLTSLTVNANAGQTTKCGPTTLLAQGRFSCIFQTSDTTWYPR